MVDESYPKDGIFSIMLIENVGAGFNVLVRKSIVKWLHGCMVKLLNSPQKIINFPPFSPFGHLLMAFHQISEDCTLEPAWILSF
jgi:hypothetical protein